MATRIENILIRARDSLSDTDASRWSDDRLLRLLDEGYQQLATEANLLRHEVAIPLQPFKIKYRVPEENLFALSRVIYNGQALPLKTHEQMDQENELWYFERGTELEAIIASKFNRGEIRPYPIYYDALADYSYTFDTNYGEAATIVDYVTADNSSPYGFIAELNAEDIEYEQFALYDRDLNEAGGIYGLVSEVYETDESILVMYVKRPNTITSVTDKLEIDPILDKALKHYIVGNALRDDQDAQNRQMGNEELTRYFAEIKLAQSDSARGFTTSKPHDFGYAKVI